MTKPRIGITCGDINGISLEVSLKALSNLKILDLCTPVIYGSSKVVSYHKNIVKLSDLPVQNLSSAQKLRTDKINVVNCWQDVVNISLGNVTVEGGKYAHMAMDRAFQDLEAGLIDAIVTAPINKESMHLAEFPFPGHTEFFAFRSNASAHLMCMINDEFRIAVHTAHIPLREVADKITKDAVLDTIKLFNTSLVKDFAIEKPLIAVLGLNPHAGDGGVIGEEDKNHIRPAIIEAKKSGIMVMGPFAADGFFGSGKYKKFDGVIAMYHDQGLIPFKLMSFGAGVNYTAGLPIVRTSPDHGTGFDIAGKNEADHFSMRKAIYTAIDISRNRREYEEMRANALVNKVRFESEKNA